MKYMKRISAELEGVGNGVEEEELIVQGVRFAFRVHQVHFLIKLKLSCNCNVLVLLPPKNMFS